MRSSPRKLVTEEELYPAALRALTRRAYSVFEMRKYLEQRVEEPLLAAVVLARLKEGKFLDDARFALEFARSRARFRRQGRHRITRELRQRGVPDRHIESAIAETFTETDEVAVVRKIIERRLRAAAGRTVRPKAPAKSRENTAKGKNWRGRTKAPSADDKLFASLYGALLRGGFDADLIRREMRAARQSRSGASVEMPEVFPEEVLSSEETE